MVIAKKILYLAAIVSVLSCQSEPDVERDPVKIIQDLSADSTHIPADGVSTVAIYAVLPDEAQDTLADILFTTNAGQFTEGDASGRSATKRANLRLTDGVRSRKATVHLISSQLVQTALVTAKVLGYERPLSINFTKALAQTLRLSASTSKIQPSLGSEVILTVTLRRDKGIPSIGNVVTLSMQDSTGKNVIGNLREINDRSNAAGQCTFIYNLPESYTGRIKLVAWADGGAKDSTYLFSVK